MVGESRAEIWIADMNKRTLLQETKFGEALSSSGWHSPYPLSYEKFDVHIKIWHIGYSIGADVTDSAGRTRWYMNTDDEWVEWLTKVELSEGYKHGG